MPDDDAIHVTDEVAAWRRFLRERRYEGPPLTLNACLTHGMAGAPPWTCWMCEVTARNACPRGCTAGTDMYYCTESPPGGDCPCKCHATGDLDVW